MSWRRLEVDRTACAICSATAALAPPPPPPAAAAIPAALAAPLILFAHRLLKEVPHAMRKLPSPFPLSS